MQRPDGVTASPCFATGRDVCNRGDELVDRRLAREWRIR